MLGGTDEQGPPGTEQPLLDPDTTVTVEPFSTSAWSYFEMASTALADPFDSAIVATARALQLPLVTRDAAIVGAGVAGEVIW